MPAESSGYLKTRVVADSKWLDWLILSAGIISLVIITKKGLGGTAFKLGDVEIPTSYGWLVFCALSVAHLYLACLIVSSSHTLWKESPAAAEAFQQITAEGGPLVRGLVPRVTFRKASDHTYIFKMPSTDLTVWPTYALMIAFVAAIVPFSVTPFKTFYTLAIAALALVYINWRIAANWIIALSDLTLPKDQSVYHARIEEVGSYFVFQETTSGPDFGPIIVWAVIVLDTAVLVSLLALSVIHNHPGVAVPSRAAFCVLLLLSVSFLDFGKLGFSPILRWLLIRLPLLVLPSAYFISKIGTWK